MTGLHQIEADIQLCEQFLKMDGGDVPKTAEASGSSAPLVSAATEPATTSGGATASMSQQRRKEILDRLLAERKATKQRQSDAAAHGSPARRGAGPATRVGAADGGGGGETREQLIQRLIQEKRDREARGGGVSSAGTASASPAGDTRKPRQAWEDAPHAQSRGSSQEAARTRPSSAPRQRVPAGGKPLTSTQDAEPTARGGRTGVRPQSARAGSAPRQRPGSAAPEYNYAGTVPNRMGKVTRPKSPNLSKPPNKYAKALLSAQAEAEQREQLTFKPKISQYKPTDGQRGDAKLHATGDERVDFLAQSKRAMWEARERAKLQREEDEQQRLCSFKPQLQAKSNKAGASPSKVPVEVRLLHTASNKQALRQRAKRHLEEQELIRTCNGNSFRPKINEASRLLDRSTIPLHERVGQVQRERQQKLHEAKVKLEQENGDLTFRPALNDKSIRIAERALADLEGADVTQRLQAQHSLSVHRRLNKAASIEDERAKHESFAPNINRNSEKILEHSDKFAGKDFFDRQAELVARKMELAVSSSLANEHSFAPDIGNATSLLKPQQLQESSDARLQRLAYRDKDQILEARQTMAESYYAQFNFKPEINAISKQLGQAHSIEELHRDEARKQRFAALKQAKEDAIEEECTFKPKIHSMKRKAGLGDSSFVSGVFAVASSQSIGAQERSRYSMDVTDVETLTQRIKDKQREKMAQCQMVKKKKEYEELKECTFTPAIRRAAPKSAAGPIVVRGLGRHLELKELAQRKAEEQAERERKVFLTQVTPGAAKPYTVPTPFQLSSSDGKHEARKEKVRQAVQSINMKECTFHPQTNEGDVRRLLQSILDADPSALEAVR